jgi:hypothetical protein
MINSFIGKYKITRFIGEGGMASVYLQMENGPLFVKHHIIPSRIYVV